MPLPPHMISRLKLAASMGIMLVFMGSCTLEQQLAAGFIKDNQTSVYILPPDFVYKSSLKTDYVDSLGIVDEIERDQVLWDSADFINVMNDSLFIANYALGMYQELEKFGLAVFNPEQVSEFLQVDTPAYQVHIAQIEIEENFIETRDGIDVYDKHYYHDHYLNSITVHSWFEIVPVNKEEDFPVLFVTDVITDQVDGEFRFDPFTNKVQYLYNTDSLDLTKIYQYAFDLGRAYGAYTYDYLLNNYLQEKLPEDQKVSRYWRYDPYRKLFFEAEDDRFIPLEGGE